MNNRRMPAKLSDVWPHVFGEPQQEAEPEQEAAQPMPICCTKPDSSSSVSFLGVQMDKRMYKLLLFIALAVAVIFLMHSTIETVKMKTIVDTATSLLSRVAPGAEALKELLSK